MGCLDIPENITLVPSISDTVLIRENKQDVAGMLEAAVGDGHTRG